MGFLSITKREFFFFTLITRMSMSILIPFFYISVLVICSLISLLPSSSMAGDKKLPELHEAAISGDIEKVSQLLAQGGDINLATDSGITPLHMAIRAKKIKMVEFLLGKGANVHAKRRGHFLEGTTSLAIAVYNKDVDIITLLLNRGADVNQMIDQMTIWDQSTQKGAQKGKAYSNTTALHAAIGGGNIEIVKLLMNHGANVNAKDKSGMTPLHIAATKGNHEAINLLLNSKADLDAEDNNGHTPFYVAVESRHKETGRFLLAKGSKEVEVKCFCLKRNMEDTKTHTTNSELICSNSFDECIRLTKGDSQICGLYDWQQNCTEDHIWP
ncbi:MAG: ankyrin repeat domain-containing protein [Thermodesulfovibrionales bacterium]